MNAIEMAAQSMINKFLSNLPPEITANIGQIGQTVAGFQASLLRVEKKLDAIIKHLEISTEDGNDGEKPAS